MATDCKACRHAAIQFGEFTGQQSWLRCRVSGRRCDTERADHKGCGYDARYFSAFAPLTGDVHHQDCVSVSEKDAFFQTKNELHPKGVSK